jgi:1-deoxy-D-xylulose-5-phosphate reductoisomerase
MNAANEVANEAFRQRRIAFTDIVPLVERVLERTHGHSVTELDEVWSVDAEARRMAEDAIRNDA